MNACLRIACCSLTLVVAGCSSDSSVESTATVVEVGTTTTATAVTIATPEPETTTVAPATTTTTSLPTTSLTTTTTPVAPPIATVAMANPVVARMLVIELEFDEGVTFCSHRLWGIEQAGAEVTTYATGFCESFEVEAGLVEMSSGSGFGVLVEMEMRGDQLVVAKTEFDSENEGDSPLGLPPNLERPDPNDPPYPADPLWQAADFFGATAETALGNTASCADLETFKYGDYAWAVAYWVREGRPDRLDPDDDGRPCEAAFGEAEVSAYFDQPLSESATASCADVRDMGFDYVTAAATWLVNGAPARMDADGNGIPCETVFPVDEVSAFLEPARRYASGLYCRDLKPDGASFPVAVAYWMIEGAPSRMDADGDGIPCETVYDGDALLEFLPLAYNVRKPLPTSLMCRDLYSTWGYQSALRYWLQQGSPARMDADANGIPCQTVYTPWQVDQVLYFDRVFRVP